MWYTVYRWMFAPKYNQVELITETCNELPFVCQLKQSECFPVLTYHLLENEEKVLKSSKLFDLSKSMAQQLGNQEELTETCDEVYSSASLHKENIYLY